MPRWQAAELERYKQLLAACWQAFDETAAAAENKELRTGPRGGGRDLQKIIQHVRESEVGYLASLGMKLIIEESLKEIEKLRRTRQVILDSLHASAEGKIAEIGPRGGKRWKARYFVRRDAWHILDHLWEIEDRSDG